MRFSRLLLSVAATSALFGAASFSVSPVASVFAQDEAAQAEKVEIANVSAFDVPAGKDEAFYKEQMNKIREAFNALRQDATDMNALYLKANVATMTCYKYLSELPDIDAADRTGYFRQYVAGLGYVGDLDGLNALLAAEEAKDPVDQSRVDLLKFQVASVSVDKAVEANDEAAIKKLGTELIEKAKTDDYWASRTPSILEDLARSKPAIGVPMLKDLCAAFAASDDESRKRIATRFEGKIRFADLVGNEMKVEGLYLDGTEIDWASYRGKVVLVDFWATWCGPCIGEIPNMTKMYEKINAAGFEILGYSLDQDLDALHKFEEDRKLPWKTASQKLSIDSKAKKYVDLSEYYGIAGIPTMILVGKDGKVLSTNARGPELERLLKAQFPNVK